MMDILKKLFAPAAGPAQNNDALPLAVAALMVEAARADESYTDEERALIDHALVRQFTIDPAAAASLRLKSEALQKDANDLHRFTKTAKALPDDAKIALVESLWRIVLSDAARHSWEDTLMRRVCGLLYVSDVDSGHTRRRVEAAIKCQGAATGSA